jgi:hypothetical protein
MSRPKKKLDLNTAMQVDGKVRKGEDEGKFVPTTLDQIWGQTKDIKYEGKSEEEYAEYLNELNTAELRTHAIQVATIIPSTNVDRLKKRLVIEYQKYTNSLRGTRAPKPDKMPSKEVLKIMSEVK